MWKVRSWNTQESQAQEARALAGMFTRRILRLPAEAFHHEGRRYLVADWETYGIDLHGWTERLAKIAPMDKVQEAVEDIEQMAALMETDTAWEDACVEVERRHRFDKANEAAQAAIAHYEKDHSTAAAASVAAAFQQVAESARIVTRLLPGEHRFDQLIDVACRSQGRDFLGIKIPAFPKLNCRLDGLRGLTFMGGMPGTGKTSLALQMAWNAVISNPDTVVVFLTCDMSAVEVQASLVTHLTKIPYSTLMKGHPGHKEFPDEDTHGIKMTFDGECKAFRGMRLPNEDISALRDIRSEFMFMEDRWRIVQPSDFGGAFVGSKRGGESVFAPVARMANVLRSERRDARLLLVVDSLERVPVAEPVSGSVTGWVGEAIERDNYVVDALKATASDIGDTVLCITEQSKAQQGAASMRGTGSIGYACDNALMLNDPERYGGKEGHAAMLRDYKDGYRLVEAHLTKGRQGSKRGSELLKFHIDTHTFTEVQE